MMSDKKITISLRDLLEFGNKCWWSAKRYWEEHPNGEATARTIKQIWEDFTEDSPGDDNGMTVTAEDKLGYYKTRYEQLVGAVKSKYPGESRHETALKYIRRAECPPSSFDTYE